MAEKVATEVGARMIDSSPFRVSDVCSRKACGTNQSGNERPAYRTLMREGAPASAPQGTEFNSDQIGQDILGRKFPVFHLDDQFKSLTISNDDTSTKDLPHSANTIDDTGLNQLYEHLHKPLI